MARGDASLCAYLSDEAQAKLVELRQVEQFLYFFSSFCIVCEY